MEKKERTRNKYFCFLGATFSFTLDATFSVKKQATLMSNVAVTFSLEKKIKRG